METGIQIKFGEQNKSYFEIEWDETVNSPIEIINFTWDKKFSEDNEYEIEGAYNLYKEVINEK